MRELALFAGAGGGILGGKLLGWRTVCAVELDPYCRDVLMARQNDGCLEPFPIWDDVRTFDGREWEGAVDVVSGGFPCQDISSAGKGAGIDGEKSGLWSEFARIIGEVRPSFVLVENSPMLTTRGLGRVLGDLAALGFDAEWGVLGAHHAGAPHKRDRIWIVARYAAGDGESELPFDAEVVILPELGDAKRSRLERATGSGINRKGRSGSEFARADCEIPDAERIELRDESGRVGGPYRPGLAGPRDDGAAESLADADSAQREGGWLSSGARAQHADARVGGWWNAEPDVGRVADGVASRMDRLKATGNGQVPRVLELAWRTLRARLAS